MTTISTTDPLAIAVVDLIHRGEVGELRTLLAANAGLATCRLGDDDPSGMSRTLLHVATDWPGHYPNGAATVAVLVESGADVNGRFRGPHEETPLHWAASSDDVAVLDALLDAGADIEAPGAVIGGGSPLADARAFRQWNVAFRLIERGAYVDLPTAATLGLLDKLDQFYADGSIPSRVETDRAFWSACHGGRLDAARYLYDKGVDLNVIPPWEPKTPLDAAASSGASDLLMWLHGLGAKSSAELRDD